MVIAKEPKSIDSAGNSEPTGTAQSPERPGERRDDLPALYPKDLAGYKTIAEYERKVLLAKVFALE